MRNSTLWLMVKVLPAKDTIEVSQDESVSIRCSALYYMLLSTSGLSHWPFTPESRVRIPLGVPYGSVVQSGEYVPVTHEVAGSKPARVAICLNSSVG